MGNEIELLQFPTRYAHSAGAYAAWVLAQAFESGEDGYMRYLLQIHDLETASYDSETRTLRGRGTSPGGYEETFSADDTADMMSLGSWWHESYEHGIAWRMLCVDTSAVEVLPELPVQPKPTIESGAGTSDSDSDSDDSIEL